MLSSIIYTRSRMLNQLVIHTFVRGSELKFTERGKLNENSLEIMFQIFERVSRASESLCI